MRKPSADPPFGPVPFAGLRLPFVDRFGQFAHADWPEKVRDPSELAADLRAERAALRPPPASWDRFGGWRDGPALEATGAFRVERLDGRWRLVDPDGRLFFSYGLDTLRHYTDAPNGHRHPAWYETEPPPNGRMAFTHWNLQRKFGKIDYLADYYDFILRRLDDWGFNTIGRWSARRLPLLERRRPYLLLLDSPARAPRIPGTRHYDPYHPDFARRFAEGVAAQTRDPDVARAADDPFCIGLSVDNEPPFGGMIGAMLAQDASGCPAKNAFLAAVRTRHPDLGALNAAWGTAFPTWPAVAALAAPVPGPGFASDASAFLLDWLRRTFSAARAAVKAPDVYGSSEASYSVGDPVDVLVRGSVILQFTAAVVPGSAVYIRKADGALVTEAGAEGTTLALPNVTVRTASDSSNRAEVVLSKRNIL